MARRRRHHTISYLKNALLAAYMFKKRYRRKKV